MSDICSTCGLPKDLCVCETIAKEDQKITLSVVRRRFGKMMTLIEGLDNKKINVKELAKKMKSKLACGGTAKGGTIELQGNHIDKVKEELVASGFSLNSIEIKYGKGNK